MQTGNRDYFGRNQFWTPSNISVTQSLIDDKLNSISLTNNTSDELFAVEASQFIITGTNEEIDQNDRNAVNKNYLLSKLQPLEDKYFLKSNVIDDLHLHLLILFMIHKPQKDTLI